MEMAELRGMALSALRLGRNWQFGEVSSYIENHTKPRRELRNAEKVQLAEIFWDLMVEGILAPCHPAYRLEVPPLHVTEYGKDCLGAGEITPHDPDGFLSALRANAQGTIDDIVAAYIAESVQCFRHREYLASTVLLGVASERCIDLVATAYLSSIPDTNERERRERKLAQASRSVKKRFGLLRSAIIGVNELPNQLKDDLDIHFGGIFEVVRRTRNDAGHPRGGMPGQREAHACLLLFPSYHLTVCELRRFFEGRD